jgi:hypothetical protein
MVEVLLLSEESCYSLETQVALPYMILLSQQLGTA